MTRISAAAHRGSSDLPPRNSHDDKQRLLAASDAWRDVARRAGRYAASTLDSFITSSPAMESAVKALRAFTENLAAHISSGHGLVLYGPCGTGKDHLMFAAMRAAASAGFRVRWENGIDWFGQLRDRIDDGGSEETMIRPLVNCDILGISDPVPPSGDLSSYQGQMLLRVIDRRYRHRRSTFVTLNVRDRAEAISRMGAPIVDRLIDNALVVHCAWESFRRPLPLPPDITLTHRST